MTDPILPTNIRKKIKKAIAAVLAVAFMFNDIAFAGDFQNLARPGLQIPAVTERMKEAYNLRSGEKLRSYVASEFWKIGGFEKLRYRNDYLRKDGKRVDMAILGIPGLLKNTKVSCKFFARLNLIIPDCPGLDPSQPVIVVDNDNRYGSMLKLVETL